MAKENRTRPKRLQFADILTQALLAPVVLKSVVVTLLSFIFIYFIGLFNLASFFVAFTAIFLALIVVQEVQSGRKGVEHSATELGVLAAIIALVVTFAKINLATFTTMPILQTLVITFVVIILYLFVVHPTKMEQEYMNKMGKKYLTR